MLRKFKIKIDGQEYLVEMEEVGGTPASQPQSAPQPAAQPVPQPVPQATATQPAPQPAKPQSAGEGQAVTAPMPGTIIKLMVQPGEQVAKNQPVMVLEAMKMENEIVAPKAGVITQLQVDKNEKVDSGALLFKLQ